MYSRLLSSISIALFAILAVAVVDGGVARDSNSLTQQEVRGIEVVKDIAEFKKSHPGLALLRMTKEDNKARSTSVRYSLGGRVSGDRLVAQAAEVFNYQAAKDVTIQLTYPQSGTGSIVTYVEIVCQQDSYDGNAYVVAGGVSQRFISIVLEATDTETFSYNVQYFGSD